MTTTATEPTIDQHPDIQELDGQAGQSKTTATPRKRGRPKGSRNRTTPALAPAAPTSTNDGPPSARFVLIEDGTLTVATDKGIQTYAVESKYVLDRRK